MARKKGLRSRAVGFLPAKVNPVAQKEFLDFTLTPLINQAKNGAIELLFLDASHFVMGGFAGRVWSILRCWVRTASGRRRYNVLGALNFITKKMETVCNDTYITSVQVVELLEKLNRSFALPIHIVLDNASYQTCKFVKENAARLGITLHYLPSYSPNLNLIERVWKLVKSKVLNSAYFDTFDMFCKNISSCVDSLHIRYAENMASLVTSKFHVFDARLDLRCERLSS
jgi:transposase